MKLSTFTIVKNEAGYIDYHILSILNYVDEMVFYDGNSTDGTIEIIEYIKKKYDKTGKIKLFKNKDCKDLKDSYVRLNNECLKSCTGDYVWFIHPDMICANPEKIEALKKGIGNSIRASVKMISYAEGDKVIQSGRDNRWATIYKNGLGLHYFGWYGVVDEDLYFRAITGDEHIFYKNLPYLPYKIFESDILLYHYCDTKPYQRRLERMVRTLQNILPGEPRANLVKMAESHPRVTLKDGEFNGRHFKFEPCRWSLSLFRKYNKEFDRWKKGT